MKLFFKRIKNVIFKHILDITFITSLMIIIINTCTINIHAGIYLLGGILLFISIKFMKRG